MIFELKKIAIRFSTTSFVTSNGQYREEFINKKLRPRRKFLVVRPLPDELRRHLADEPLELRS